MERNKEIRILDTRKKFFIEKMTKETEDLYEELVKGKLDIKKIN